MESHSRLHTTRNTLQRRKLLGDNNMAHNRIRRTTAAAVTAVALLAGVAACSSNSDEPNVTLTATGNPAFDGPDGKTEAKTPDEQARSQAIAKVNEFYAALGSIEADPTASVDAISGVAGDPVLNDRVGDIMLRRSQGITSTGAISVIKSSVTDLSAPVDDQGKPRAEAAWVHVQACTDISGWNAVFPDGSSAMKPDRGQFESTNITVRNPAWPDSNGWRVTSQTVEKVQSCD